MPNAEKSDEIAYSPKRHTKITIFVPRELKLCGGFSYPRNRIQAPETAKIWKRQGIR